MTADLDPRDLDAEERSQERAKLVASSVVNEAGCWIWQRSTKGGGYGYFHRNGRTRLAHRASYEAFVGPIPPGLVIDHLCRNRACVNPDHLEPVTNVENVMRGMSPAAIHARSDLCKRGHVIDGVRTKPDGSQYRYCKTCNNIRNRRRPSRAKAVLS